MDSQKGRHVCPICGERFALKATLKAHSMKHGHPASNTGESAAAVSMAARYSEPVRPVEQLFSVQADISVRHFADGSSARSEVEESDSAIAACGDSSSSVSHETAGTSGGNDPAQEMADDAERPAPQPFDGQPGPGSVTNSSLASTSWASLATSASAGAAAAQPSQQKATKTFGCKVCMRVFDAPAKLTQHKASQGHLQRMKAKAAADAASASARTAEAPSSFPCPHPVCGRAFDNPSKLLQHQQMKKHAAPAPAPVAEATPTIFVCPFPDCGRAFDDRTKLSQHQATKAHEAELRCEFPECTRSFPTEDRLRQHQRDKHAAAALSPEPPLEPSPPRPRRLCNQCDEFDEAARGKSFIFLTFIAKHMVKEHFPPTAARGCCPVCGQKVDKAKNLLTHIARAHLITKFPEEACFICLRLCQDKNDLQQHTTSVHRFKCLMDECNSMFPSKDLRDKHMLQKHAVHVCGREDCQMIFSSIEEKNHHASMPHPVDSDSDASLRVAYQGDSRMYRYNLDTGVYSEPQRFLASAPPENHPFSADELRSSAPFGEPPQYAAHRLLRNQLSHMREAVRELRQTLRLPVEQRCARETVILCREVVEELNDVMTDVESSESLSARLFHTKLSGSQASLM